MDNQKQINQLKKQPVALAVLIVCVLLTVVVLASNRDNKNVKSVNIESKQNINTEVEPVPTTTTTGAKSAASQTKTASSVIPTTPTSPTDSKDQYYAITSVVDGDTVKVSINGRIETLRLIGLDTPETVDPRKSVQCFGKEASNKGKELLVGKKVRIEKDATQGELDKYGRTLAYIYREDGLFYNKYMIEQGYAHEYTYNTPYKYQAEFKAAQKLAQANQKGLWSPDTCNGDTTKSATPTTPTPAPTPAPSPTPAPTPAPTNPTTQSSGKYYTSSYGGSKYYYPQACSGWESLSPSYLKSFDSLSELLAKYPSRTLSPSCQ